MPYNLHHFILPLIFLFLLFGGFGYKSAQNEGKISQKWVPSLNLSFGLLFLFFGWQAIEKMQEADSLRGLKPEQVSSIAFYHEARDPIQCKFYQDMVTPACLETTLTDRALIAKVVQTLRFNRAYSPNHEGPRSPYFAKFDLKQGQGFWLLLGRGVRDNPETIWLEIENTNIFVNPELYQVLKQDIKLTAWR